MNIILVHDHFDTEHLETVKSEMLKLGQPTIKATYIEMYDSFVALEGCHRIRAAKELGLNINIEEIDVNEYYNTEISEIVEGMETECTLGELIDSCTTRKSIKF